MGGKIQDAVKITLCCQLFHGRATRTVGVKGDHLISHILQELLNGFSSLCDKPEHGKSDALFLPFGLPLALYHSTNGPCCPVQDATRDTVYSKEIHHAVHHCDVLSSYDVCHVPGCHSGDHDFGNPQREHPHDTGAEMSSGPTSG